MASARMEQSGGVAGPSPRLAMVAGAVAEGLHRLSEVAGGGSVDDVGGAFCWYSDSRAPVYNGAAMFYPHLYNRGTVSAVHDFFSERGRPYTLVTLDGLVPSGPQRLLALGYEEFDYSPAMWLQGPPQRWQEGPQGQLRIARVGTAQDLEVFRAILSRVFSISAYEVNMVLSDRVLELPHVRHYVAYLGSTPVGTASLVISGPMAGVWNVGTLPEYRRRG